MYKRYILALVLLIFTINQNVSAERVRGFYQKTTLWPDYTNISVCWENFRDSGSTATHRTRVRNAVRVWESPTGIRFTGWGQCGRSGADVRIKVSPSFHPKVRRFGSALRNVRDGVQLNFNLDKKSGFEGCKGSSLNPCISSISAHEFGHVLGLYHEQNRHDNVKRKWCKKDVFRHSDGVEVGSYDAQSIMNYCVKPYNNGGLLSTKDRQTIRTMYPHANAIGIIPNGTREVNCPVNTYTGLRELITIHMDDEDSRNANRREGWTGGITQSRNTDFRFCRVDGNRFKPLNNYQSYAVLKLGRVCPSGSSEFSRYFDNEDNRNANSWLGNIYPNISNRNTTLKFCLFKGKGRVSGTMSSFPSLGAAYGLFAPTNFIKAIAKGKVHTDDEDGSNRNNLRGSNLNDVKKIIDGGRNTTLNTARVRSTEFKPDEESAPVSAEEKAATIGTINLVRVK